jgi:hypothetical protein
MKSLRILTRSGSLALMCFLAFSCVDESYDLEKADYNVVVLDDAISLPMGSLELGMDSILKVDATKSTGLQVKGNMYYLSSTSKMDISDLNNSLSGFTLAKPADVSTNVNMVVAPSVPYNVPVGTTTYSGSTTLTLPNFTTSLINVKRVTLKNTTFTMKGTTTNMGGTNLNNSIVITCTPQDQVAEYYIDGVKVTSWTMKANEDKVVEIRSLNVTNSSNLVINYNLTMTVATSGAVQIINNTQSYMGVGIKFNGIDFDAVYGKVTYSKSDSDTQTIDGLSDLIGGNNNVLSLYNPSIKFKWSDNLGVPVSLTFGMSTKNATSGQTASLSNNSFTMTAASSPTTLVVDSFIIDRNNGTSNLFKINPSEMTVSYSMNTNTSTVNSFIPKNLTLDLESTFTLPLQFGSDLLLNVSTDTITNPFLSILDKLAEQPNLGFGVTFDIVNRIPLGIKIRLSAENQAGSILYYIETADIKPAKGINAQGFATDTTMTKTKLAFNASQVDQFKNVARFRVNFIISASQSNSTFVTLSPQDYIKLNVGAEITGGVNLDLNKKENQ